VVLERVAGVGVSEHGEAVAVEDKPRDHVGERVDGECQLAAVARMRSDGASCMRPTVRHHLRAAPRPKVGTSAARPNKPGKLHAEFAATGAAAERVAANVELADDIYFTTARRRRTPPGTECLRSFFGVQGLQGD
jgi:hypothetical protein